MTRRLSLDEAVAHLRAGELVGLPTDTVYGVGAILSPPGDPQRLFALKRRPAQVALPVLGASLEQFAGLGIELGEDARRLASAFWPGALTVVVRAPSALARALGARESSVGLRIPDDDTARQLLAATGPLAVSSANLHGQAPCQSAEDIERVFGADEALAGVLDDGPRRGTPSTVISVLERPWRVLREGAVSRRALAALAGDAGLG